MATGLLSPLALFIPLPTDLQPPRGDSLRSVTAQPGKPCVTFTFSRGPLGIACGHSCPGTDPMNLWPSWPRVGEDRMGSVALGIQGEVTMPSVYPQSCLWPTLAPAPMRLLQKSGPRATIKPLLL